MSYFSGKSVLIIGASGFIGTHLARRLHRDGAKLFCLDICPPREHIDGQNYITGDVRKLCDLSVPAVDIIFNLAAIHTTPGHLDHEYYDTNVFGAFEVSRFAEINSIKNIVFTSSISIYGPSEDRKVEDTPPNPTSAYGKSKLMAEKAHEAWRSQASDRKLTIVRPAVVFGPGEGGNFTRMARLLKRGFFVFPGRRDTIKSCIYVDHLIDLMIYASSTRNSFELLNGSYQECPKLETILEKMKERYFPKAIFLDIPKPVMLFATKILSKFNTFNIGIHPDRVQKLLNSTYVYPDWWVRHELPQKTLDDGLKAWAIATDENFQ